jgi:hypothetical protein
VAYSSSSSFDSSSATSLVCTLVAYPKSFYVISTGKTITVIASGDITLTKNADGSRSITGTITLSGYTVTTLVLNASLQQSGTYSGTVTVDGAKFNVSDIE